jgi:hypothetical protein
MKKLIVAIFLLCSASAFANGVLQMNGNMNVPIQGFAPNGLSSALLTVNNVTYDMTNYLAFSVYSPADCKIRLTATSSRNGSISEPVIGGQWNTIVVNSSTPFASFSGCTSGYLRRQ